MNEQKQKTMLEWLMLITLVALFFANFFNLREIPFMDQAEMFLSSVIGCLVLNYFEHKNKPTFTGWSLAFVVLILITFINTQI